MPKEYILRLKADPFFRIIHGKKKHEYRNQIPLYLNMKYEPGNFLSIIWGYPGKGKEIGVMFSMSPMESILASKIPNEDKKALDNFNPWCIMLSFPLRKYLGAYSTPRICQECHRRFPKEKRPCNKCLMTKPIGSDIT